MIITSKYSSCCSICEKTILAGAKVEWKKGEKAVHVECHKSIKALKSSQKNTYLNVQVYKNGFFANGPDLNSVMYGDITGFIQREYYDETAEKFMVDNGYVKVTVNTTHTEWKHVSDLTDQELKTRKMFI